MSNYISVLESYIIEEPATEAVSIKKVVATIGGAVSRFINFVLGKIKALIQWMKNIPKKNAAKKEGKAVSLAISTDIKDLIAVVDSVVSTATSTMKHLEHDVIGNDYNDEALSTKLGSLEEKFDHISEKIIDAVDKANAADIVYVDVSAYVLALNGAFEKLTSANGDLQNTMKTLNQKDDEQKANVMLNKLPTHLSQLTVSLSKVMAKLDSLKGKAVNSADK